MTKRLHKSIRLLLEEHFKSMGNSLTNIHTDQIATVEDVVSYMIGDEKLLEQSMFRRRNENCAKGIEVPGGSE